MQLGAVHEIQPRGEDFLLPGQKRLVKLRRHRRFNAHVRDILFRQRDVFNHPVRAVGRAEIEAQFVQSRFAQRAQRFLRSERSVCVKVLMNARFVEFCDYAVIFFNFHKRFEVYVGNPRRLFLDGQKQIEVALVKLRPADFPHALADRRLAVHLAVIIAETTAQVAFVRLAHGRKAGAQQARFASAREFCVVSDVIRAPGERFEAGDFGHQLFIARVNRVFDLCKRRVHQFLLMRQNFFLLRQRRKKLKPHQRVFF